MPSVLSRAQQRFFRVLLGVGLVVFGTAAYLFVADPGMGLSGYYQVLLAAHFLGGALLLVLAASFLAWHLTRVRRLLRSRTAASGAAVALAALLLFASGIFIFYESKSREHFWIFRTHQILALALPVVYAAHRFAGRFRPARGAVLRGTGCLLGLVAALLLGDAALRPEAAPPPPVAEAAADPFLPFRPRNFPGEDSPFFPSSATTSSGGLIDAALLTRGEAGDPGRLGSGTGIGAQTCRRCHADIVAQWETSAHRFSSFNNPFYRAAVEAMRASAGTRASNWCAGCHDPVLLFQGAMDGPVDPSRVESQAGLTCLACHAIDSIHGLEGNGNYNLAVERGSPYLFDDAKDGWRRFVADQMIKAKPTAHRRALKTPLFETSEFCLTCHKVSVDVPLNAYRYLRGQDEYDNWHDSGVAHNAARTFYLPDVPRSCQDCHMPREEAVLGDVAAKDGTVRSHRFLSVNNALPFLRGDEATLRLQEEALRGAMTIDVFALDYTSEPRTMVRALDPARPVLVPGEEVIVEVVVRNRDVGHTFPGGTTDSNEAWVDFEVRDEGGRVLFRSGAIDAEGHVDARAHFYRVVMVRHDGTEADRRDVHTFHVPAHARLIGPGTADVVRYALTLPPDAAGSVTLTARLAWRKFNRRYTQFVFGHLERPVPTLPVLILAQDAVTLPVAAARGPAPAVGDAAQWMRFNDHGIASFLQEAYDVAEASFAEVARLRPDLPDGHRNLARRWIASGTPERALPLLRKVDQVAPRDPQRPYFWGRYFERVEEYEAAAEAYRASLEVFPRDRDGWRHLGAVLFKLHRHEESLAAYLEVLAIDPEDREAHKRRLDLYRLLGREAEAAEAQRAFEYYRPDDEREEIARRFLLSREDINHDAQRRHLHR